MNKYPRVYQPGEYLPGQSIELSQDNSQHIGVVLRMRVGEGLILFSGNNEEYIARICDIQKKKVWVNVLSVNSISRESPCHIELAQGIAKGDRMEWIIQKAVELGVTAITPLLTTHSVVRLDPLRLAKKHTQWQAIAISACEQSGRNQIPHIFQACTFESYLKQCKADLKFILHPGTNTSWREYHFSSRQIALMIGPEGGFHEEEIRRATADGCNPLSVGPRILRTETATITALSILQAMYGDL